MRHVDDAHHAERDGKADGGEQQHRTERKPVPGVLRRAPEGKPASRSTAAASCRGLRNRSRRFAGKSDNNASASWSPRARITAMASILSASVASGRLRTMAARASLSTRLTAGVGFLAPEPRPRPRGVDIARFEDRLRRFRRFAHGFDESRSCLPSAASITRRNRLVTRTVWSSAGAAGGRRTRSPRRQSDRRRRLQIDLSCSPDRKEVVRSAVPLATDAPCDGRSAQRPRLPLRFR